MSKIITLRLPDHGFNAPSFNGYPMSEENERRACAHRILGALENAAAFNLCPVAAITDVLAGADFSTEPADVVALRRRIDELESAIEEARSSLGV